MPTKFIIFCLLVSWMISPWAAPLDVFLETHLPLKYEKHELILGIDHSVTSNQFKSGDYRGWHLRGSLFVSERIRLDGGYWSGSLDTGTNWTDINTWKVGAQWQFLEQSSMWPALALRYSLWNDSTDLLTKASFTFDDSSGGKKLTNVRVTNVEDQQHQLNIIASWKLNRNWNLSLFSGFGKSKVSFGNVFANYKGCDYLWTSPTDHLVVAKITPEDAALCSLQEGFFEDLAVNYPGPNMDIAYKATYFQFGGNFAWRADPWYARVGYHFQSLNRELDDEKTVADNIIYKTNHLIATEIGYNWSDSWITFIGIEYMRHQTVGEIPLLYNAYTASRFKKDYGLLAVGIKYIF